jgi:hypothetical protein
LITCLFSVISSNSLFLLNDDLFSILSSFVQQLETI